MPYSESHIDEHLRRILLRDCEFGEDKNISEKNQTKHIVFTALTHIHMAVQLSLESDYSELESERPIGESEQWYLLQMILRALIDVTNATIEEETERIDMEEYQMFFNTINNYFRSV